MTQHVCQNSECRAVLGYTGAVDERIAQAHHPLQTETDPGSGWRFATCKMCGKRTKFREQSNPPGFGASLQAVGLLE